MKPLLLFEQAAHHPTPSVDQLMAEIASRDVPLPSSGSGVTPAAGATEEVRPATTAADDSDRVSIPYIGVLSCLNCVRLRWVVLPCCGAHALSATCDIC